MHTIFNYIPRVYCIRFRLLTIQRPLNLHPRSLYKCSKFLTHQFWVTFLKKSGKATGPGGQTRPYITSDLWKVWWIVSFIHRNTFRPFHKNVLMISISKYTIMGSFPWIPGSIIGVQWRLKISLSVSNKLW